MEKNNLYNIGIIIDRIPQMKNKNKKVEIKSKELKETEKEKSFGEFLKDAIEKQI